MGIREAALAGVDIVHHSRGVGPAVVADGVDANNVLDQFANMDEAKALDLVDEAGARVKLSHSSNTQVIRELERDLNQVSEDMNEAVSNKDFERAVILRENEIKIRKQIQEEKESVHREDRILEVNVKDIEQVVSAWTGVPVTAMKQEDKAKLSKMGLMSTLPSADKMTMGVGQ